MRVAAPVVVVALLGFVSLVGACGEDDKGASAPTNGGSLYSTAIQQGVATFYDASGGGNCGFDPSPDDLNVAAFDANNYAGSAACGACVKIKGELGEITVRIVDNCPDCTDGNHLDLSRSAFAKIADPTKGRVPITYQTVACAVSGSLAYHFKDGSSKYWTAIQVRNHRLPVAKLEYQKDGAFVEMKRESYNYFVDSSGVGDLPNGLVLRVTAADGQAIEEKLPGDIPDNKTVEGAKQFK